MTTTTIVIFLLLIVVFGGVIGLLIYNLLVVRQEKDKLEQESKSKSRQLEQKRETLKKRPSLKKVTYRVVTIGIPGTGKTSLTLKWANPTFKMNVVATKFERYIKKISSVKNKESETITDYQFEILDYGGERIVAAQNELVTEEIHGILFVVDLGEKDELSEDRIKLQLNELNPHVLKFFFSDKIIETCQTVVLFINKSDLISGRPLEVAETAKKHFEELISNLSKYKEFVEIEVIVGSSQFGTGVIHLFPKFITSIFPTTAYDESLLQGGPNDDIVVLEST